MLKLYYSLKIPSTDRPHASMLIFFFLESLRHVLIISFLFLLCDFQFVKPGRPFCMVMKRVIVSVHTIAGRPSSSEVPRNPLDTLGREFDPGKRDFLPKRLKNKNKNAQRVENDSIVSTQNSTSRSTRERNG